MRFVDRSGASSEEVDLWPSMVIPKEDIDAEVERLAGLPAPENGRRCSLIAHPRAQEEPHEICAVRHKEQGAIRQIKYCE